MAQQQTERKKVRVPWAEAVNVLHGLVVRIGGRPIQSLLVSVLGQVGHLRMPDRGMLVERYIRGRTSGEVAGLPNVKVQTVSRIRKVEDRLGKALAE